VTDIDEAFLAERERIRKPWRHVVNLGERFVLLMGPPADKAILADAFRTQPALIAEIRRLREVIAQHDLCHDLHGKVDARAFANGCASEQRRIYGCSPDADDVRWLRAENAALQAALRRIEP
jgi:hypothetical protein